MRWRLLVGVAGWLVVGQPVFALDVEFVSESGNYGPAVVEYRKIWREDGTRIIEALGEATGVSLGERRVRVIVREGISRSGIAGQPMYLRASYPLPTKRATLVHELAHRYLLQLDSDTEYSDIHFPLSLLLYEVWSGLWSEDFARTQAKVESRRSQRYRKAWEWVLSMSDQDRTQKWNDYVSGKPAPADVTNAAP